MQIIKNRMGVPALVEDDGTVIWLEWAEQDNLQAIDMQDKTVFDALYQAIKESVAQLAPIDPDLELGEWMIQFNQMELINQFSPALHVLNQARMKSAEYESHFSEEELT